jgi:hypothetical protein
MRSKGVLHAKQKHPDFIPRRVQNTSQGSHDPPHARVQSGDPTLNRSLTAQAVIRKLENEANGP